VHEQGKLTGALVRPKTAKQLNRWNEKKHIQGLYKSNIVGMTRYRIPRCG